MLMARKAFAFIHVNVIPMDEERVLSDQTVIIENARIREIGDAAHVIVPDGAIKIDASDQYMIPAFADMHVHLEGSAWNMMVAAGSQFTGTDSEFSQILFPYLANGVTTVQVMSAFPEHITLRDRINRGEFVGPRLILNRMIDGSGKAWPPPICSWVDSAAEAYQSVEDANLIGYDGMKVYSFLNQECYDAIMTKASTRWRKSFSYLNL